MRIVTGLAASGKTSMLLREIAEKAEANRGRQILLVPELNSHQMERRLAAATHNHGARTAEVLTFSRLADRVFAVVGGLAQQMLTPAGQLLTLQEAARRVQVGLTAWSGLADKPELLSETLALIDECKSCMIEPETLFRASEESALDEDAALSAKLRDLAQILTQYDSLCGETLPDPRDRLTHLRDGLAESHVLDGTEVYLDGFLSYTPQELAIIEVMLSSGVPLTAAVTCDVELPDVFVTGCRTLRTLTRMAERCSRRPELVDLGAGKMPRPAGLAAVANEALLPVRQAHEDASGVRLYEAASPFDECEHAAAYIRRKVRDEGAHYRDFVIAARDIGPYSASLAMAMGRYDIPMFLADKPDLLSRPPMALVIGALESVRSNFGCRELFGCLKTGLTGLAWDEIDRLENYAITWKIHGAAWERDWVEHPDGYGIPVDEAAQAQLNELNELRARAIAPFAALRERLKGEQPSAECVRALYDFLLAVDAPRRMEERAAEHDAAGRLQLADEYRQLWEILVSAMEQFAWVRGDMPLTLDRFAQLFRLVLSGYSVGSIPVSLDRVSCGNIERVCGGNVKYVILLGVNDGLIPKDTSSASLISDSERDRLDALGVELKASGEERLLMEQETLYRALACPCEELLLSWHASDASGGETRPSYFVGTVRGLLPNVPFTTHRTATVCRRSGRRSSLRARISRATAHRRSRRPIPFIRMTSGCSRRQDSAARAVR